MHYSLPYYQAHYWKHPASLKSAQNVVASKCHNMAHLLASYLPYQQAHYPARANIIRASINKIYFFEKHCHQTSNRNELFRSEAAATLNYWAGVRLLAKQPNEWKRDYPSAKDPLNKALNIGYHNLAQTIRTLLKKTNLELSIGVLHAPKARSEALVYDLQELCRQSVVDKVVIPLFSRPKTRANPNSSKVAALIYERMKQDAYYKDGWWQLADIITDQVNHYIRASRNNLIWEPYRYDWSHRTYKKSTR